jgi:hypothetical protein
MVVKKYRIEDFLSIKKVFWSVLGWAVGAASPALGAYRRGAWTF